MHVDGELFAGRYEIRSLLGTGAMGSVFLARDRELDELVAVKMLKPTDDDSALERFRDEVRLARRVTHRNVARTFDIGEQRGEWFLTMEFVAGESLARRLDRLVVLPIGECVRIGAAICDGLAAAHEAGVIHRDLKPANVMLAEDGRAVVTDFGVARRRDTHDGLIAGTPIYMAPEQLAGIAAIEQSDLYAVGAMLYRMATGRNAFDTPLADRSVVANPCERRAGLPAELGRVVLRCLSVQPVDRFASARDLARALLAIVYEREEVEAPPPTLRVLARIDRTPRVVSVRGSDASGFARALRSAIVERLEALASLRVADDETAEAQIQLAIEQADERVSVRVEARVRSTPFWSTMLESALGGVGDLAASAAARIATALALDLPDTRDHAPLPPDAVEPYLDARMQLRGIQERDLDAARATFEELEKIAPQHPLIVSSLALARARATFYASDDVDAVVELARRAVACAPDLPDAHLALATALWHHADAESAAASLVRALALAPGNADAEIALARILIEAGAPMPGIDLARVAVSRVPSLETAWIEIGRASLLLGRVEEALAAFGQLRPSTYHNYASFHRCRHAAWQRKPALVRATLDAIDPALIVDGTRLLLSLYEAAALDQKAPRVLADATEFARIFGNSERRRIFEQQVWTEIALIGGDLPFALEALSRAVGAGLVDVLWLDRCPLFFDLLGNTRFESLRDAVRARARGALRAVDAVRDARA